MEKLRITKYFDSIINEIDVLTETKIKQNQALEQLYNERRQKQIEIVKAFEQESLLSVGKTSNSAKKAKKSEEYDTVGGRFLSVIEFADTWFLVRANKTIGSDEKELFRALLRWPNLSIQERLKILADDVEETPNGLLLLYHPIYPEIEINTGFDLSQFRTIHSPVIDVGPWLDREFNVEEIKFTFYGSGPIRFTLKPINSLFRIKKLHISIEYFGFGWADARAEIINQIVKCFGRVDNVLLEINCSQIRETFEIDELVESFKSNGIHEKLSIEINYNASDQMISTESSYTHLNRIELWGSLICFSSINWSHVKDVEFRDVPFKDLEWIDFSSLQSLKSLLINSLTNNHVDEANIEWHFLDPIRENLEKFDLGLTLGICLSWKTFRKMHKLKELNIDLNISHKSDAVAKVEFDSQKQLFADLHELKRLSLDLNEVLMTSEWSLDLANLEELSLCVVETKEKESAPNKVSFNLPKLVSLTLNLQDYKSDKGISFVTKPFYGVQELQLNLDDLNYMKKGYFREFKSLKKLSLFSRTSDDVDSETFIGLENLVKLTLDTGHSTNPGALSRLQNLELIHLSWGEEKLESDYKSLFDGLVSLEEIVIQQTEIENSSCQTFESFVYFESLNKFVLEVKILEKEIEPDTESEESTYSEVRTQVLPGNDDDDYYNDDNENDDYDFF